ncbi:MAG: hypothetical protein ACREDR_31655 [Blastocatellia bacterium]
MRPIRPWLVVLMTISSGLALLSPSSSLLNLQKQGGGAQFGPPEGSVAPSFSARDQFGNEQTLKTIEGKNGLVLLFFRSADW